MNDRTLSYIQLFLTLILVLSSVVLGFLLHGIYNNLQLNKNFNVEISEYEQCNNLSLRETSKCLRDYISTFYNYTIRSDEIRTIDDIKQNGGDCYDYNRLYERLASQLGFDSYTFRIAIGEKFHRVAVITDETGYCLLDQIQEVKCVGLIYG